MVSYWDNIQFPAALKHGQIVIAYDAAKSRVGLVSSKNGVLYYVMEHLTKKQVRSIAKKTKNQTAIRAITDAATLVIPFVWKREVFSLEDLLDS